MLNYEQMFLGRESGNYIITIYMSIKPILEASYKPVKQAKKDYEKLGYKFDSSLSSPESKVFVRLQEISIWE